MRSCVSVVVMVGMFLVGAASPARADIIPVFKSADGLAFVYDVFLDAEQSIMPGDPLEFMTIYDIPGIFGVSVPGASVHPDLTYGTGFPFVGQTPPGVCDR